MHARNSFVTLTYSPENLPKDQSITKDELQRFFKRLRKKLSKKGVQIRYFACGEYGEKNNRPHYHAIIFGTDFPDRQIVTQTKRGDYLYRSPTLDKAWGLGHAWIGDVTFESAAYVARYVMKKRKGDPDHVDPKTGLSNKDHYLVVDPKTGEAFELQPEFCIMSRRPGIGKEWLEKYKKDTDKDFITIRGKKMKLPKYYDSILEMEDEIAMIERKAKRKSKALKNKADNTFERLAVKETVKKAQLQSLTRDFEKVKK